MRHSHLGVVATLYGVILALHSRTRSLFLFIVGFAQRINNVMKINIVCACTQLLFNRH